MRAAFKPNRGAGITDSGLLAALPPGPDVLRPRPALAIIAPVLMPVRLSLPPRELFLAGQERDRLPLCWTTCNCCWKDARDFFDGMR